MALFCNPSPLSGAASSERGAGGAAERSAANPASSTRPAADTVEIISVPKSGVPVTHFRVLVLSGSADDPPGKEGLAGFTARLLRRGTRTFSREQIDDGLDQIAASLGIRVQKEFTVFSGVTLRRNLGDFYRIFSEVLLAPRFDPEEIEKLKTDQIDAVEAVRQSDEALGREVFFQELFAGRPYGHLHVGTLSSIRSFTAEDVKGFYKLHYVRGNVAGGLAGDVDEALIERLRRDLQRLPPGRPSRPPRPEAELSGRRAVLVEKEGRTQTHLRIGHPIAVTRAHPDYAGLRLANTYLGHHRNSIGRLYQVVREQRGLSYGAYSYSEYFLGTPGPTKLPLPNLARGNQAFHMWIYPRSENAAFVLKLAISEMAALDKSGIPAARFNDVRDFIRNSFAFEVETPLRRLAMELDERLYGTRGFAERFPEEVAALTPARVRQAASDHLRPADLLIVAVVPDAEAFKKQLLSGEAPLIYPSGVDSKPLEEDDARVREIDLRLEPKAIKIVKAADLFR
ncbi:MAG: pitrilysin family protein [Acidobacteriota bacterium]